MRKLSLILILVTSLFSVRLLSQTFPVTNTNDAGAGSLRQAIVDANAYSGTPTITFEIPSSSVITVISTELPNLNKAGLTVDGTTATGYSYPNSMVTISWASRDDCFHQYLDNVTIKGLTFTNNNSGTGDAAIRAWSGSNLLVEYCRAYNQNKKFVRTEGGTLVQVKNCTIENFANDGNAKVFEALGGGFLLISQCNITNIPRRFIELISSGVVVTTIEDNVLTNVGYEDNSAGGGRGAHAIQTANIPTRLLIRNNTINGCKSKFIQIERNNTAAIKKDSIYNNTILNCTGSQVIYMTGRASNDAYIGNNYINGDGGIWQMDQVIYFNNLNRAFVVGNVLKNMKAKGIQVEYSDNSFITGNNMYNLSGDCYLEVNSDCDILTIRSNIMGTDSLNTPGLSKITGHAVKLNDCDDCTFGGDFTLGQGNQLIGGSTNKAMEILSSCTGVTKIQGNDINVSSDGLTNLSTTTGENIIHIMTNGVIVGGDINLYRNRISGTQRGIQTSNSTTIQGNYIGCTQFGSPIIGSAMQTGIEVQADNVTIGSKTDSNLKNKIGYCEIAVRNDNKQNVLWTGNEFFNNTDSRVLYNNGDGSNNGISKPVITGGMLPNTVSGTSRANARVEVYHWNPSKPAQGYQYLGFASANGSGAWTFTSPVPFNDQVAALQIDGNYSSEFASYNGLAIQAPTANSDNSSSNTVGTNAVANILSNDLLSNGSPATAAEVSVDLDLVTSGVQASLSVAGQGIWAYNAGNGVLTFDPQTGFGGNPTIIQYQLIDNSTGYSDLAVVSVGYTKVPPIANDDVSDGNAPGMNAVITILSNDKLSDGSTATPASVIVDINPAVVGIQTSRTIFGIGVWTYNPATGELTFDPQAGFILNPPVLNYTLKETASGLSDIASVTVSYSVAAPIANNDVSTGNFFGANAVVPILVNDKLSDGNVPTPTLVTVDIDQATTGNQAELFVPGEGFWNYQAGNLTFDPLPGSRIDPSIITYTLTENSNSLSDNATVTVNYIANPALNPPLNLEAGVLNNNDVQLTWETPAGFPGEYLHWDSGNNFDGIGLTEGGTFSVAARWKPAQLAGFAGQSLTHVKIFPRGNASTNFTLKVWSGAAGSTVLVTQTLNNLTQNQWNTIILTNPVVINATNDLWVGYTITDQPAGVFPAGCDAGPAQPGYGDMIRIDGVTWIDLKDIGYNYNWNIQAGIEASFDGKTSALPLAEELLPEANASNQLSRSFVVLDCGQKSPDNVTGYNIFKNATFLTTVGGTETSYFDNDLANGVYSYKVSAVFAEGESDPAGPVIANIPGGTGPSISVSLAPINEIHSTPPQITTRQLNITNTGTSMLDVSIETAVSSTKTFILPKTKANYSAPPTAIPDQSFGKWQTMKFESQSVSPNQKTQQVIRYDDGSNYGALGSGTPGAFEAAIYFPASVMQPYTRMILKQMEIFVFYIPTSIKVKIYSEGTPTIPGQLIFEQVVSGSLKQYSWNTVDLGEGVEITGSDLWLSYEVVHTGQWAAGIDNGPVVAGFGDWLRDANEAVWVEMHNFGFNFNWNLAGILFDPVNLEWLSILPSQTSVSPGETVAIDVTFDSDGLTEPFYEGLLNISSNDPINPVVNVPVSLTLVGCAEPINLIVTDITTTSANLSWTPGGTETAWEYVYGVSPLPIPTGTGIQTASSTNNGISGLSAATTYQYYVRTNCGSRFSSWAGPFTFTTDCGVTNAPFTEGFETLIFPPTCWSNAMVVGDFNWERSTAASGYGAGTASALANFFDQESGSTYDLMTLNFNASTFTSPVLKFDYAYATYTGEVDEMNVYYSTDGGGSYDLLLTMPGGESGILNTGGTAEDDFVPTSAQWASQSLALPTGTNMIKFQAISAYGNNLYLDNVKIYEPILGWIEGYVYKFGTTTPINGATVTFSAYSTTTNAAGYYSLADVAVGTYDVTSSATGYISQTVSGVTIASNVTTTQNFNLAWANITVNPSSFTQTLVPNSTAVDVMQISNIGGIAPLDWSASIPNLNPLWVSVLPASGTVNPGATQIVNVNFNTAGLLEGTYNKNIEITHNGQLVTDGTILVPVTLTVAATGAPVAPSNPDPSNNATLVPLRPVLSWTNGLGTVQVKVQVYKGASPFGVLVYESAFFAGNSVDLSTIPITLAAKSLHSWKVTSKNSVGQITGPVWSFTTKGTGTINGLVTDSYSGLPVAGATITASELNLSATTGSDGKYSITEVPEGACTVIASHPDYNPELPVQVIVPYNGSVSANFALDLYLDPPYNLQANVFEYNNVHLEWLVPDTDSKTRNSTKALLSFNIYRNGNLLTNTPLTEYDNLGLLSGTYNYTVTAVYNEGESSAAGPASVVILPAPVLVSAIPDYNGVNLVWTEGSPAPVDKTVIEQLSTSNTNSGSNAIQIVEKFNEPSEVGDYNNEDIVYNYIVSEVSSIEFAISSTVGNRCDDPIIIGSLPYTNVNTTCGRGNDYSNTCLGDYDSREDIVYKLVVNEVTMVDFAISSTTPWVGMLLTQECPIGNNCITTTPGGGSGNKTMSAIVDAGSYYLMIDAVTACINQFTITINSVPVCQVECPAGAIPEGEACSENINDGCNNPANPQTTPIVSGDVICGKAWANGGNRDTDWYEVVLDSPKTISWTVTGEFPSQVYIIDGNAGCAGQTILSSASALPCTPAVATVSVPAGTYWLWAGVKVFDGYSCGLFNDYVAELTCEDAFPYFNVFRDGNDIANVYGLSYYDEDVNNGESHCYTVSKAVATGLQTPQSNELCAAIPFAPAITVNPAQFTKSIFIGESESDVLNVNNLSPGTLVFSLIYGGNPWLTVATTSGTINGIGQMNLTVTFNANGLLEGTYFTNIVVTSNDPVTPVITVPVTLHVMPAQNPSQNIILSLDWNGWSSFINPSTDATFADVIAPVVDNMIISQYFGNLFWPLYNINTMGAFSNEHGYLTKMSSESLLTLNGTNSGSSISLNAGWNLIPVLSTCNVPATQLLNIPGLVIAWEVAGNGIYYPAGGINTLNSLVPGKAYYVKVSQAGSFTFPACGTDNSYSFIKPLRTENITNWNDVTYTGSSHAIVFSEEAIAQLAIGDVIGAFTDKGLCAGMVIANNNTMALSLFADDISTVEIDGFADGQAINFKVIRPSTGEEFVLDVTYDAQLPNSNGLFVTNGLSVINNLIQKTTGINATGMSGVSIYPNPSTGIVNITGIDSGTNISITGLQGQSLFTTTIATKNACQIDLSGYQPGVYFIKIEMNGINIFRKLILQ